MNIVELPLSDVAADLRPFQHRAVTIGGTLATNTKTANGLLNTRTDSGEDGSMTVWGRDKFVAGGTIAAGNRLRVTSGGFMVAASSGYYSCGYAETAISSGSVGRGFFDFATLTYHAD